ncbi:MAG: DEAD/DEAH box helicase [Candidatus Aenigmarchaeota archaeon]|nr:DEAD/DEAH box helicase [Candidatus Aenigmarchaeota archaeon]
MDEVAEVLQASGFPALNPVQRLAVERGLDRNLVVAAPTASGKTLIAEIAALKAVARGKKAVYIVPLRALAQEKYEEFTRKYPRLKVALSIGDLDASDAWLAQYDLIVTTSEKLDSLLRHGITWLHQVGLVIADEIHLLTDPGRGPTLEMVLTRLQEANPVIIGLSATIRNHDELAGWLRADAVKSDYRPVKLYTGVCYGNEVLFSPHRRYPVDGDALQELAATDKQSLVFISTRKGTEAAAEKLGKTLGARVQAGDREKLTALADKVLGALEHKTAQCDRLARCVLQGTAFHHAGLTHPQRSAVEKGFRQGLLRVVCATPTLAAGLNLPAYRVIIRDLKRFSSFRGMDYLPALEIQQMAGRAGRPAYDTEGEAILLPKTEAEADHCWETYINGETERITSKLGVEPVLRTHVLALIAGGLAPTTRRLEEFFSRTFYAYQYKDLGQLRGHLEKTLRLLERCAFITMTDHGRHDEFRQAYFWEDQDALLQATPLGKRVAELYVDPLTADLMIRSLGKLQSPFSVLHLVASSLEMKPPLTVRKGDVQDIEDLLAGEEKGLVTPPPAEWDLEYEDFFRGLKLVLLLGQWMEEKGEDLLLEQYGVTPGELRARLEIADWLLYAVQELALLGDDRDAIRQIRKTRLRLRYGIREELLPLVKLKGVGRVRARRLFAAGLGSLHALRQAPLDTVARAIGPAAAASVKDQVLADREHDRQATL